MLHALPRMGTTKLKRVDEGLYSMDPSPAPTIHKDQTQVVPTVRLHNHQTRGLEGDKEANHLHEFLFILLFFYPKKSSAVLG